MHLQHSCIANQKVSSENRKVSSEEEQLFPKSTGFIHIYVPETWCSFTYGSSGAAFGSSESSFVMTNQQSNRNGFRKRTSFLLTRKVPNIQYPSMDLNPGLEEHQSDVLFFLQILLLLLCTSICYIGMHLQITVRTVITCSVIV